MYVLQNKKKVSETVFVSFLYFFNLSPLCHVRPCQLPVHTPLFSELSVFIWLACGQALLWGLARENWRRLSFDRNRTVHKNMFVSFLLVYTYTFCFH